MFVIQVSLLPTIMVYREKTKKMRINRRCALRSTALHNFFSRIFLFRMMSSSSSSSKPDNGKKTLILDTDIIKMRESTAFTETPAATQVKADL